MKSEDIAFYLEHELFKFAMQHIVQYFACNFTHLKLQFHKKSRSYWIWIHITQLQLCSQPMQCVSQQFVVLISQLLGWDPLFGLYNYLEQNVKTAFWDSFGQSGPNNGLPSSCLGHSSY